MTRAKKIEEKVLNSIWKNGGHWVEIEMKVGDKLYIQRQNFQSYEDLEKEKFRVMLNGKQIKSKLSLTEVATYINNNY